MKLLPLALSSSFVGHRELPEFPAVSKGFGAQRRNTIRVIATAPTHFQNPYWFYVATTLGGGYLLERHHGDVNVDPPPIQKNV